MTPKQPISVAEFDKLYPDTTPKATTQTTNTPNQYGATFRATGDEGGIEAGFKAAGNVPSSAFNLGKNIVSAVSSPVETAKGLGKLVFDIGGGLNNLAKSAVGIKDKYSFSKSNETPTLNALGEAYFGEEGRYGSMNQALKTAIEDPFGVGSDILGVVSGGAGALGKTAQLNSALSTTAKVATAPVRSVFSGLSKGVVSGTKFGASQLTGLSPETISTITKNSKAFGEAQASGVTRTDLAENVLDAVKKAGDELSDLGSGYDDIRAVQAEVALPETWLQSSLDKYGLKFQNTKVSADKSSATRNVTDLNKIQEFIDNWGDSRTLTPDEYLNMRHDLAELAKYEVASGKSSVVQKFAQDVREGVLNADDVRGQVPGLKELDAKYAADKTFFKQIERDFINKETGGLKDGAASKVVNAINAANPERLARLEKLYPGFTKQAKVIKAVEDVENAMGLKVGTYARAGVAATGILTGNAPVVIAAILSTPEIAVPLLKGYGYTADKVGPILQAVSSAASDINNFRVPGAIEQYMKENYKDGVPVGMSTKNVGVPKGTTDSDLVTMREYSDMVFDKKTKLPEAMQIEIENKMSEVSKRLGLKNAFGSKESLASEASKILDNAQFSETLPKVSKDAPPTSTTLDPKNFKTVEEYVKAQGTPVYHGGAGVDKVAKEVKILTPEEKLKLPSSGGNYVGLSTSPDKSYAQQFSRSIGNRDDVAELYISPKARKYTMPEGEMIDDMPADELTKLSKMYDIIESLEDNEIRILNDGVVKTRTQLIDEWKKANETKP